MFTMTETLAERLKAFRMKMHQTQAEMAERIGASRQQYANWEHGRAAPGGVYLDRLEGLGFTMTWTPFDDAPTRIRATRRQLKLLVDILASCDVPSSIRENARQEIEKALGLDSED